MGIIHQIQKVRPHKGLTATDIELKHLVAGQAVDYLIAFIGGEFARPSLSGV
jgi:hypothetical protein